MSVNLGGVLVFVLSLSSNFKYHKVRFDHVGTLKTVVIYDHSPGHRRVALCQAQPWNQCSICQKAPEKYALDKMDPL